MDAPGHVRLPDPDTELIDRALDLQSMANTAVTFATGDTAERVIATFQRRSGHRHRYFPSIRQRDNLSALRKQRPYDYPNPAIHRLQNERRAGNRRYLDWRLTRPLGPLTFV